MNPRSFSEGMAAPARAFGVGRRSRPDLTPRFPSALPEVAKPGGADNVREAGVAEQLQRMLGHPLAEALAREQLGLRLGGQVGDVEHVLDDQGVDHVLDHAHEVGIEAAELLGAYRMADEGLHVRVLVGEELARGLALVAMQALDLTLGVAADEWHGRTIAFRRSAARTGTCSRRGRQRW